MAALAATRNLGNNSPSSSFSCLSSFQSTMLTEGLKNQIGWGHVWNRYAGPFSCNNLTNQCAFTPLLPPGWWDGLWQSPLPKDINILSLLMASNCLLLAQLIMIPFKTIVVRGKMLREPSHSVCSGWKSYFIVFFMV